MSETPKSTSSIPEPFILNDDRQELIYDRLYRLVSPSIAGFYKDACRHMATSSLFSSTTNIVGHLLREIESALHDVLEPVAKKESLETSEENEEAAKENHRKKIEIVIKVLNLPDDIAKAWLSLPGKKGLQRYAHRSGLNPIRPVDADFKEFWYRMEIVLNTVLNRFEAQYGEVFTKLDELSGKGNPTGADRDFFCKKISNHDIVHAHFFNQLENPRWLPLLKSTPPFLATPEIKKVTMEDGSTGFQRSLWPPAVYLEKVAEANPLVVSEILEKIQYLDNPDVKAAFLSTAAKLPREFRIRLIEKIKDWMKTEQYFWQLFLVEPSTKVIEQFVEERDEESAFSLVEILLEILPDPKQQERKEREEYKEKWQPRARMEEFPYNEFLEKEYKKLLELNSIRAFELLCKLLEDHRCFEYLDQKEEDHCFKDYSYISRPAIEDHAQNLRHEDIENVLISGIRDSAVYILKKDPKSLEKLLELLSSRKWTIFTRIALFLTSEFPEVNKDIVRAHLTADPSLYDKTEIKHEFARLLRRGFPVLEDESKAKVLEIIEKAKEHEKLVREASSEFSEEEIEKYKEVWQRNHLSFLSEHLDPVWKKRYEDLVKKYGNAEHPDFSSYISSSWPGPLSDADAKALGEMNDEELISYLKNWAPKKGDDLGSSKEGLGREVQNVVKTDYERFNVLAERFKELDPTYIRSYLQAFHELAQPNSKLNWKKLLELCLWVSEQVSEIPERTGGIMNQDPDWRWTKKTIASFISDGLVRNLIPFEEREGVWKTIENLTSDTYSASEEEGERNSSDAYTLAINSVRGEAMGAVIQYALWIYRNLEKQLGKEKMEAGFDLIPEVRNLLNIQLESYPSIAVRAMYGKYFPWLLLMDKTWTQEKVEVIFPTGKFEDPLYRAAWDTLIMYNPVYDEPFSVLKEKYAEALHNLEKEAEKKQGTDRDERVAEHLMLVYGRGKIDLSDEIIVTFWKHASDELRGHAMDFVGRTLKEPNIPQDVLLRFKKLWESRAEEVTGAKDKSKYKKEMATFGWWFSSGKFDNEWSFQKYLFALGIGSNSHYDHVVVDRLSELVSVDSLNTVRVLAKLMLEGEHASWTILGSKEDIRKILNSILQGVNEEAEKEARELIHRLVSRGYPDFRDLL